MSDKEIPRGDPTREQLTFERLEALIDMIKDDGESPAGQNPPSGYLRKLKETRKWGDAKQVSDAHKESVGPPDLLSKRGNG
jgi:hypothetical protein